MTTRPFSTYALAEAIRARPDRYSCNLLETLCRPETRDDMARASRWMEAQYVALLGRQGVRRTTAGTFIFSDGFPQRRPGPTWEAQQAALSATYRRTLAAHLLGRPDRLVDLEN